MTGEFPRPIRATGGAVPTRPRLVRDFKQLLVHFYTPPLDYLTHFDQPQRRTLGCAGPDCLRCEAGESPRSSWYAAIAYSNPSVSPGKDTPAASIFTASRIPGSDWRPGVLTLPASSISSLLLHAPLAGVTAFLVRRGPRVVTIDYAWPKPKGITLPPEFELDEALAPLLFPVGYAYTSAKKAGAA
jgi:hypothetical protein